MFFEYSATRRVMLKNIIATTLLLTVLFTEGTAHSAEALELEADSASYNNQTGVAVYHGNVKISQGDIVLEGDVVEVHSVDDKITKLIATANPSRLLRRDKQQTIEAEAHRIEYEITQGIVDFIGQVKIKEADKLLTGDHAVYDIEKKTINMKKQKNRVKLIIQPETKTP